MILRTSLLFVFIILHVFNISRAQQIVKDINTAPGSIIQVENVVNQRCIPCGNYVYFLAKDDLGTELWKTDGTEAGTVRVVDFNPGPGDGFFTYENLVCNDGILYFRTQYNFGLWRSDGTASGTRNVNYDFVAQGSIISHDKKIAYYTGDNDPEVKIMNGAASTTLKRFTDTATENLSISYIVSTPVGIMIQVRVMQPPYSTLLRTELWKSDGTPQGTTLIKSSAGSSFMNMYSLSPVGDKIVFQVNNNSNTELWVSDGTAAGTTLVTTLPYLANSSDINFVGTFGSKSVFSRSVDTWITDGTAAGTKILISGVSTYLTKEYNGSLYLTVGEGLGYALYKSDGTPGGTQKLDALGSGIPPSQKPVVVNDKLLVPMQTPAAGLELGSTSGNVGALALLKDINPGTLASDPRSFANLGNMAIFMANDGTHGYEIWKTDGTPAGTALVKDVVSTGESANIDEIYTLNEKLYFLAGRDNVFRDLWVSDGTEAGTVKALTLEGPTIFGQVKNNLIISDAGFTKTDGTTVTKLAIQPHSGMGYPVVKHVAAGDNLFFPLTITNDSYELFKANIVTNDVSLVKDIYPGYTSGLVSYFDETSLGAAAGDKLIFPAKGNDADGEEVWVSDGTSDGTFMLKNIHPSAGSEARYFASAGDRVFFTAISSTTQRELWVTNGTIDGTKLVKDINPSGDGVGETWPARLGNKVVFSGKATDGFEQPWISDGTPDGTTMIKNLNPNGSYPTSFTTAENGKVYFIADDGVHGTELFVTDGTATGTRLIDVVPGAAGSDPEYITPVKGSVFFYAGNKIYRTGGTEATTKVVADIKIASALYPVGKYVCFLADDPQFGRELFRIDITKFPQEIIFPASEGALVGTTVEVTSTSGLPVTVTHHSDNVQVDNGKITLLTPGPATIEATQPGDGDYDPAETLTINFCANPPTPVMTWDETDPKAPVLHSSADNNNQWFNNNEQLDETTNTLLVLNNGTYKVRVSVEGCRSEFSASKQFIITGIEDPLVSSAIYPNPATSTLRTTVPQGSPNIRYDIFDQSGRIVLTHQGTSDETFDVSHLARGTYILRITNQNQVATRTFIKE